jgi:hypothetical protein
MSPAGVPWCDPQQTEVDTESSLSLCPLQSGLCWTVAGGSVRSGKGDDKEWGTLSLSPSSLQGLPLATTAVTFLTEGSGWTVH